MKRLTKDNPQENFETMMNYVFSKDGWAHIRHDGERENVPFTEWVKAQCIKRGCDEFPGETAEEIDMTVCDCLMDGEGCPVALAYCFACQASHLRDRLKAIEDILGDEYDLDHLRTLAQAEKEGRLVVMPCKVGDTVYFPVEGRWDSAIIEHIEIYADKVLFAWTQYDVGPEINELWDDGAFALDDIGKTVFLTRQEAEEALREEK